MINYEFHAARVVWLHRESSQFQAFLETKQYTGRRLIPIASASPGRIRRCPGARNIGARDRPDGYRYSWDCLSVNLQSNLATDKDQHESNLESSSLSPEVWGIISSRALGVPGNISTNGGLQPYHHLFAKVNVFLS